MRTQHEIQDPTIKGIFFLLFGFMFLVFGVVFPVAFFKQGTDLMTVIMITWLIAYGVLGFIAAGIKFLKDAAHPELEEQEQEQKQGGGRSTGIVFLNIGLYTSVLTVWFLTMGLLRTAPAVAVFCMTFSGMFFFFGIYMYMNKLVSLSFSLGDIKLDVKKKKITADVANREALVHKCIIIIVLNGSFFVMGTCLTIFGLWPFLAMVIIGSIFLISTVRILYYSRRKDFKIIYTVPEPEPQYKKESEFTKIQTDSTLQGDSVHSIPYTAKPGKESVFNNQRVLEAEAEMERLKAIEEQRKQRAKAREERRQAQSEEYRQQVQAKRERIANALAKKKSVFFIVAGLLLLVPFLVCLWCDFEIFEVLRSFSTTIFWYDDSIGRLFSHALRWLPALVVGCGLLVFGLYRKWMIKKKQAKYIDNQNDKSAEALPEFIYVEGDSNLRTKIRNFKAHHPKLFVAACVLIGLIVCYIVLCVVAVILTTYANS